MQSSPWVENSAVNNVNALANIETLKRADSSLHCIPIFLLLTVSETCLNELPTFIRPSCKPKQQKE